MWAGEEEGGGGEGDRLPFCLGAAISLEEAAVLSRAGRPLRIRRESSREMSLGEAGVVVEAVGG